MKVQRSCSRQCTTTAGEIAMMGSHCSLLSSSTIATSPEGDQTDSTEKREICITSMSSVSALVAAKFVSLAYL